MSMAVKQMYERDDIVRFWADQKELQLPEVTILNILKAELRQMKMLDIGVGGGRTTLHFAKLVKEYIGIDFSNKMIEICRKKYATFGNNVRFEVCDARCMDIFPDNFFDFVLFVFNGIDHVHHDDRLRIFKEIKRVCKDGSIFCFSAHNILSVKKLFSFSIYKDIINTLKGSVKFILFKILNERCDKIVQRKYALVSEYYRWFRLKMYYINPDYQIRQLNENGFSNVRVFSLEDGNEIVSGLSAREDFWLYYLCNVNK